MREPDLAGYNIQRADEAGELHALDFTRLNTQPIRGTDYQDRNVGGAESYTYYVTAVDQEGNESAPSELVTVTPGTIVVWLPKVQGIQGQEVRVPINARNASGISPTGGIDISVAYDRSFIEYVDPTSIRVERTAVTSELIYLAYAPEQETADGYVVNITCLMDEGDPLVGMGHLFDVFFKLRDDAPEGECSVVNITDVSFYDPTPAPLDVEISNTPEDMVDLICVSSGCNAGDLNSDGDVDSADVIIALQIAVELVEPDACQRVAGDINGDERIDSADALMIQRLAVGMDINPPQPGEKLWGRELPLKSILKNGEGKTVELDSEPVVPGQTVTIPLTIDDAEGLSGFDLEVSFPSDKAVVSLVDVDAGDLSDIFQEEIQEGDGYVQISMSSQTTLGEEAAQGGSLVELTFEVTEKRPGRRGPAHQHERRGSQGRLRRELRLVCGRRESRRYS